MLKSTKKFVLHSETQNSYGFRVRTSGIDLTEFLLNPLMLWLHQRPSGKSKNEVLPLGYWEDVEVKNGKIYGVPVFDDTDPFAVQLFNKVENGTIKMASLGLKPNHWSADITDPWLEKSTLKEVSLCDIGSNADALVIALYDANDNVLQLSDKTLLHYYPNETPRTDMKQINLNATEVLPLLALADGTSETLVFDAIKKLVSLSQSQAADILVLTDAKTLAETKATEFETKLAETVKLANTAKITDMVNKAETDRKITKAQVPQYIKLAESDFDTTKEILDALPTSPNITKALENQTGATTELAELSKLSYAELDKANKLVKLKALNETLFKEKFKTHFGKEYAK